MTDIARLGFRADTNELKDAKQTLDQLVPSAKRAEAATEQLNFEFINMGTSAGKAAQGAMGAKSGMDQAATGAQKAGVAVHATSGLFDGLTSAVGRFISRLSGVTPAANGATSSLHRMGRAANDNINAMQSTPGNIAAQFQDIGVTAAAGMSPMLIALQQGTQLSAAMAGGLGNLLDGLKQVFNATTLLTIGLVGVIAALIQWVDWIGVAQAALNGLADILVDISPYLVGIAGALALIYAPQIIAGIWALTKGFIGLAASMIACLGIPALIVLGLAAIIAAANVWRDELTQMLGVDIVGAAKTGVNSIIAFFVGGYNAIAATWSKLPGAIGDWAIQAANAVLTTVESMINGVMSRMNVMMDQLPFGLGAVWKVAGGQMPQVDLGQIDNPFAGQGNAVATTWGQETRGALGVDYLGQGVEAIQGVASDAADWLRSLASGLGGEAEGGKDAKGRTARAARKGATDRSFKDFITGLNQQLRALMDVNAQVGLYGEELARLKYEQQLFNQAQDKGIKLTDELSEELKRRAAEMASLEFSTIRDQFMEQQRYNHEQTMWMLGRERGELGLTGQALEAYRMETDLLADARAKNLDLTEPELAALRKIAAEQAAVTEAINVARDALNEQRALVRGFFNEWYDGILQGKNIFASFVDAVIGGLQRIAEKMMDRAIDKFLDMMFMGNNGGGSDPISMFFQSMFGSLAGGGIGKSTTSGGSGSLKLFAKGGVVDGPTIFSQGLMGEAGRPEGILPLTRSPDGTLGVQGHGVGGQTIVNAPVEVNNHYTISGAISSQDIVAMIRQGSEQTKRDLARELPTLLGQYQNDGAMV